MNFFQSQPGSKASQRSKPLSKKSNVDETLFAGTKSQTKGQTAPKNQVVTSTGIITLDELRAIREKTEKNNKTDAVIISKTDLQRIKGATVVKTKDEILQEKKVKEEQKNAALAKSKARKAMMQELDEKRAQKVKPNEFAVAEKNKAETLLSKAQKQLDNDLDDVKHMNQMVLYAKVVTIRDKQIDENKQLEKEWVDEQKKLDLMMEIERLKVLREEEEREKRKQEARKQGA